MFGRSEAFFLVTLVAVSDPESVVAHLSVDHVFPFAQPFRLSEFASGTGLLLVEGCCAIVVVHFVVCTQ